MSANLATIRGGGRAGSGQEALMNEEKTNFDRYLERKLQDAAFRARYEAAQHWPAVHE